MSVALLDHLWQSTLFAGGAALLALALRRNGARIRFWLWFAASVKFLLPFSLLVALGGILSRLFPAAIAVPPRILAMQPVAAPFSVPAPAFVPAAEGVDLAAILLVLWSLGLAAILVLRLAHWSALRRLIGGARDLALPAPVAVRTSASLLEPGLVGIWNPVVLLPQNLLARLSVPERDAILAHELSHLRRGDNLTAAIHMLVEMLFWFYPPVWLIGARLIAERERACDESVLASGHDPLVYAEGILKVCKFCMRSPLACASGAGGADLRRRLETILLGRTVAGLGMAKRLLLAGVALAAIGVPVLAGFATLPLVAAVQKNVVAVQARYDRAERKVATVAQQLIAVPFTPVTVRKLPRLKIAAVQAPPLPRIEPPPQADFQVRHAVVPDPAPADAKTAIAAMANDGFGYALRQANLALAPTGAGDPYAVTCRAPQQLPGSRLPGPEICKFNRIWARLRAQGQDISPDGKYIVATARRFRQPASCDAGPHPAIAPYSVFFACN